LVLDSETPMRGEIAVIQTVQGVGGWFEPFAVGVRAITGTESIAVFVVLASGWLALVRERLRAVLLLTMFALLVIVQAGMKVTIDRDRPSAPEVEVRGDWTSRSFPSGHAMGSTFFWGYLAVRPAGGADEQPRPRLGAWWRRRNVQRLSRSVPLVIVGLTPFASLYLGVHWPSDVLAGLLLGAGLLAALRALEMRARPCFSRSV
jgi:membrane-associated phospholipid phosphatase